MSGVVASPHEIRAIRKACGDRFMIIAPRIRLPSDDISDQRRVVLALRWVSHADDVHGQIFRNGLGLKQLFQNQQAQG